MCLPDTGISNINAHRDKPLSISSYDTSFIQQISVEYVMVKDNRIQTQPFYKTFKLNVFYITLATSVFI